MHIAFSFASFALLRIRFRLLFLGTEGDDGDDGDAGDPGEAGSSCSDLVDRPVAEDPFGIVMFAGCGRSPRGVW